MQLDLFPKELKQAYLDHPMCDMSEPSFTFTEATNYYSKHNLNRIIFLSNLPKESYYIFRYEKGNPDGLPYVKTKTGVNLKPTYTRNLYPSVGVAGKTFYMHNLVALYFLKNDNPDLKSTVDHIDGDLHNYRVENLQWLSQHENMKRRGNYVT